MAGRKRLASWPTLSRKTRVESWLRLLGDTHVFTLTYRDWNCHCPLAEYFKWSGYRNVHVLTTHVELHNASLGTTRQYALTAWMTALVFEIDRRLGHGKPFTVGDVRSWLKEV